MPNYGAGPILSKIAGVLGPTAQARLAAWQGASSPVAGATAVVGTVGSRLKGTGGAGPSMSMGFAAAVGRWVAGPESGQLHFK